MKVVKGKAFYLRTFLSVGITIILAQPSSPRSRIKIAHIATGWLMTVVVEWMGYLSLLLFSGLRCRAPT